MRDSLKKSAADSPVRGFERYPSGSIVICNHCALPIFKLEGSIALGDKAGRMADRFKPLTVDDLAALADRADVDAGLIVTLRGWTLPQRRDHVAKLHEVQRGDPMLCPCCWDCFVQVVSVEKHEALDQSYTIELVTIPPVGAVPIKGRQIGYRKAWVH